MDSLYDEVQGMLIIYLNIIILIKLILWRIFSDVELPGFATLAAGLFFFSGIQLLCIGILGEYIGKINKRLIDE